MIRATGLAPAARFETRMALHPAHPWIDPRSAPIYAVTYPGYDPADARALADYVAAQKRLYQELARWTGTRAQPFAFVVDLSHVQSMALNRQRAIQYLEHVRHRGNPHMVCRAFVAPNDSVRGVMTAVFWQSPPDYPHGIFASVQEAKAWARQQMSRSVRAAR
jgi:hypothetical protein